MRYLRKEVYECSELVGRSRKEEAAQIEVKSKLKKNLFGYIKTCFEGEEISFLKGQIVARIKLYQY